MNCLSSPLFRAILKRKTLHPRSSVGSTMKGAEFQSLERILALKSNIQFSSDTFIAYKIKSIVNFGLVERCGKSQEETREKLGNFEVEKE